MVFIECDGFAVEVFAVGGRGWFVGYRCREGFFNSCAGGLAEFLTVSGAAFENFDAVVGVGVVRGGDVEAKVEAHFVETVVDGWGRENADARVFEAKGLAGGCEVGEDPFGGFAGVAAD